MAEAEDALIVGHRLMEAGEYELALRTYYRAAVERGADGDTLSAIGAANLRLGRLGQAEQVLRRALEREPESVPALNNLGVVMSERARWGEARHLFQSAFALDSGRSRKSARTCDLRSQSWKTHAIVVKMTIISLWCGARTGDYLILATP
jgi:Flp pilus assembly protein TadD